jgi:hypothetical protein
MGRRPKLKITGLKKKKPKTNQKDTQKDRRHEEAPVFPARRPSNMPPFKDEHILVLETPFFSSATDLPANTPLS